MSTFIDGDDEQARLRLYYLDYLRQILDRLNRREPPPAGVTPLEEPAAREMLARYQADTRARMAALTTALAATRDLAAWRADMERELRLLHTVAAALGRGGFAALTADDVRAVGRAVERQMQYVNRWTHALTLPAPVNADVAAARAQQYAGAATETYWRVHTQALGMPDLYIYPGSGVTRCLTACRCRLRIVKRDGDGNFDVWWIYEPEAQHCPDCPRLVELWSPLEIRNGLYTIPK